MIFLLLLLFIIPNAKICLNGFNDDYISKNKTISINGIFVYFVFYRHILSYVSFNLIIDKPMTFLNNFLLQCIVATFLFYSGYGIYEQIKKNKKEYIKDFPKKRLLKIFICFQIALLSFLFMNLLLGKIGNYSIKNIMLSIIGWDSIGNSNWYIFLTFILYIFTYISFKIFENNDKKAIILLILFTLIYCFIMVVFQLKPQWWMDTSLCFSLGILYSYYKKDIEKIMFNNKKYYLITALVIISYLLLNCYYIYFLKQARSFAYLIISVLFCLSMVFISMKVSINNKVLLFFGKNVFWIYILQRIPFIIFNNFGMSSNPYMFFTICFITTLFLSYLYFIIVDKKLIKKVFN